MEPPIPPISHSMRAAFKTCPRKVFYRYIAGIEPHKDSKALAIGKAFHEGLDTWRTTGDETEAIQDAMDLLKIHLKAETTESLEDEMARVTAYLAGYFKAYPLDPHKGVKPEVKLTRGDDEVGFVDALWTDHDGQVWIIEDKTRSILTKQLDWVLELDEQTLNYGVLLRSAGYKTNDIGGVIYRETKKAGIKRTKKETADDYCQRVLSLYTDTTDHYLEHVAYFSNSKIVKFASENYHVDSAIRACFNHRELGGPWYRNTSNCVGKYGQCEYLQLCATGSDTTDMNYRTNGKPPMDGGKYIQQAGILRGEKHGTNT